MDALNEILEGLRVRSTIYCPLELRAPWGLRIVEENAASFCVMTRGSAYFEVEEWKIRRRLSAGDFVILMRKCVIRAGSSWDGPAVELQEWLRLHPRGSDGVYKNQGDGEVAAFMGGVFQFENHESNPLLNVLPGFLHFSARADCNEPDGQCVPWFGPTLDLIIRESESRKPGSETVISRLSDVLFIQAVRAHATAVASDSAHWFAAVDPNIGKAIAHIHRAPQNPWTVEQLARLSGMSRSAFASRFAILVGEPPLRYLSRWRMHRAVKLIEEDKLSTAEIASLVGYSSETAFCKAFKKWNGQGPGAYRRSPAREAGSTTKLSK